MNNFFLRFSEHYGMSLINFVYWMFIDLEIRPLYLCVYSLTTSSSLTPSLLSTLCCSFLHACHRLFSFSPANKRRSHTHSQAHPYKNTKKSISRAFYHSPFLLVAVDWTSCFDNEEKFRLERMNGRWGLCRRQCLCILLCKKKVFLFFHRVQPLCRHTTAKMFVATNHLPKWYAIYHLTDIYKICYEVSGEKKKTGKWAKATK